MTFRQKRNGIWVVDYLDDTGARKRVSTGVKSPPQRQPPPDARKAGREIVLGVRPTRNTIVMHPSEKPDGRLTVSALLDKCELTIWHPDNVRAQPSVRSNLKVLRSFVGGEAVEDMTYTRLEQLVGDMKAHGYAPATIKRKLAMLGKALKMATMWTDKNGQPLLAAKPPLPTIVVNNLKDREISPEEETALFVSLEKRRQTEPNRQWFAFRVLLVVLFATAGRLGETIHRGPKDLTRLGGVTMLTFPRYQTKSGKPRTLPLTDTAVEALGTLMDHLVREGDEWKFFGFTENTAQAMFRTLREDVLRETGMDMSDVTLHTIRHTTLTRLARGGMDLARLQEWAGHSDPKITAERYLHLRPSDLVSGLAILDGTRGTAAVTPPPSGARHDNGTVTTPAPKGAMSGTMRLQ